MAAAEAATTSHFSGADMVMLSPLSLELNATRWQCIVMTNETMAPSRKQRMPTIMMW
jgi:hypothetical protein